MLETKLETFITDDIVYVPSTRVVMLSIKAARADGSGQSASSNSARIHCNAMDQRHCVVVTTFGWLHAHPGY